MVATSTWTTKRFRDFGEGENAEYREGVMTRETSPKTVGYRARLGRENWDARVEESQSKRGKSSRGTPNQAPELGLVVLIMFSF